MKTYSSTKKILCTILFFIFSFFKLIAQSVSSESFVDWTKLSFDSNLSLDMNNAGLSFPAGKNVAVSRINSQLSLLIKDPLFALYVDSSATIGDLVVNNGLSFDSVIEIIDRGNKTPGIFDRSGSELKVSHNMKIQDISSILVKHKQAYIPKSPIEQISTRPYTGIIIDARGTLPVHGEFISEEVKPCFFPKIWDEDMNLLYERNMTDTTIAKKQGIVSYHYSDDESLYRNRIGQDPLRIKARKVYGANRTDPLISKNDYLKIFSCPENIELLKQGKVVILLDKENLIHAAAAPLKDEAYYVVLRELTNFLYESKIPDTEISNGPRGTKIAIQNLQFVADSSELLPSEKLRLDTIADMLRDVAQDGEFSITVEGHTASVGKPNGELNLSIERAQAIIKAMAERNVVTENFTYKGFGGTMPIGDNDTPEGRAKNRRVEIMIIPKATYIQRN